MSTEHSVRRPDPYQAVFHHLGAWTEDDYLDLSPELPGRVELVDGALLVSPLSAIPHSRMIKNVTFLLDQSCPDPGWEALPGARVKLWPEHIREPDVVVIRAGLQEKKVDVADVLMLVEVTSPGNLRQDMIVKHGDYAEAGVPFYLRIDLHTGIDALTASAFELIDGAYRECASAPDGILRLPRPWPVEADLRALARGRA